MADKKRERILVVDDEASIRKIISFQLDKAGYDTILAVNGREGVDLARKHLPDLILLDLMMPELNGHEVVELLRKEFQTSQIPIIILTAKFGKADRMAGLSAGVNDYLTKPFELNELLARIRNVLEWSKKQRSANPLTGLPGNICIEEELEKAIHSGRSFAVAYVDLDNFKAYNDHYGYNQGDAAIREIARILIDSAAACGDGGEFIGHIGGDDFLYIASPEASERIGNQVIEQFDRSLKNLIRPDDLRRGHIEVIGRTGDLMRFPLLSVTIAIVGSDSCRIDHVAQVGDMASEVKRQGKSIEGSVLVKDRRADGEAETDPIVLRRRESHG